MKGALADSNIALELAPKNALFYNNRALMFVEAGDQKGAMADLDKAIYYDTNYAIAYGNRAQLKIWRSDNEGALADLNQAIALEPKNADFRSARGALRVDMGDNEGALSDCKRAIELNPKDTLPILHAVSSSVEREIMTASSLIATARWKLTRSWQWLTSCAPSLKETRVIVMVKLQMKRSI